MNWKQYFELIEKRHQWFKRIFVLLVLIHLYLFWRKLFGGAEIVCGEICPTLNTLVANDSNLSVNVSSGFTWHNFSQNFVQDYVWYDCSSTCYDQKVDNIIMFNRVFFGPAFILVYLSLAYVLASVLYLYKKSSVENPKKEEDKKEDKKGEKKS